MLYRKLGNAKVEVSILGFGCMRFPTIDDKTQNIDEQKASQMLEYAISNGVNYLDVAYPYHGQRSEPFLGKFIKQTGYRDKVYIATKLPVWLVNTREDMDMYLNEQLKRLKTDYIDFYLLHALDEKRWKKMLNLGVLSFIDSAIRDGKIRYAGFSYHDNADVLKKIIDAYDWILCQIQYNYLDEYYQAGRQGLEYAASKDIGIVVMEPLRGGQLANNIPQQVKDIFEEYDKTRPPVEWALRFIWDHPEIGVVLSGMSDIQHVKQNINIANTAYHNSLTAQEKQVIRRAKDVLNKMMKVNCTYCNYCMPCPYGVSIPECFSLLNNVSLFGNVNKTRQRYLELVKEQKSASRCIKCGRCEKKCPQHINIRDALEYAVDTFER